MVAARVAVAAAATTDEAGVIPIESRPLGVASRMIDVALDTVITKHVVARAIALKTVGVARLAVGPCFSRVIAAMVAEAAATVHCAWRVMVATGARARRLRHIASDRVRRYIVAGSRA